MLCFGILVLFAVTSYVEALSPSEHDLEEEIAKARPKIEYENKIGWSPLHVAAKKCRPDVVQSLIGFSAKVMVRDAEGNTPYHLAIGCPGVISLLVEIDDSFDERNEKGATPLLLAVRSKDLESIRVLLKNGFLPLMRLGDASINDEVLASGDRTLIEIFNLTNVVTTSTEKATFAPTTTEKILHAVTKYALTTPSPAKTPKKGLRELRVPLKRPNGKDLQLQSAARQGMEGKIVDLCSDGLDPNFGDVTDNNYTPLHLATIAKAYSSMLTLIACGAKVDCIDRDGNTPLHIATMGNDSWGAAVLLLSGADPYVEQRSGITAYQMAMENKDVGTMSVFNRELLEWYNDVRPLSSMEKHVHLYTKMGRYASGIAKSCIAGVNVNIKDIENKQRTALHIAVSAEYNGLQTVQMLVRCGGNVNARDADGNTPLHLAAIDGNDQVFTGLLLHKADPFMVNFEGKTAHQLSGVSNSDYIKYMAKFGSHRYEWFMNNKFL